MVPRARRSTIVAAVLMAALVTVGCASNTISLRSVPKSPLVAELDLASYSGPKASARTTQLLRVYNLSDELGTDFRPVLQKLQAINDREPSADNVYALSELAFLGGKKAEAYDKGVALDLYGASVLHAYDYLFDARLAATRNPYDPNYRRACDLYNGALEAALRIVCATKELVPDTTKTINTASGEWDITCSAPGHPLAEGRLRTIRVRLRLRSQGAAHQPLSDARIGRAVDRRPSQPEEKRNGRAGGGQVLPRGSEFPRDGVLRPLSKIDPTTGQAAAHNQCSWNCTIRWTPTRRWSPASGCRWKAISPRRWPTSSPSRG